MGLGGPFLAMWSFQPPEAQPYQPCRMCHLLLLVFASSPLHGLPGLWRTPLDLVLACPCGASLSSWCPSSPLHCAICFTCQSVSNHLPASFLPSVLFLAYVNTGRSYLYERLHLSMWMLQHFLSSDCSAVKMESCFCPTKVCYQLEKRSEFVTSYLRNASSVGHWSDLTVPFQSIWFYHFSGRWCASVWTAGKIRLCAIICLYIKSQEIEYLKLETF